MYNSINHAFKSTKNTKNIIHFLKIKDAINLRRILSESEINNKISELNFFLREIQINTQ